MGRSLALIDFIERSAEASPVVHTSPGMHSAHKYPHHGDIRLELTRHLLPVYRRRILRYK